MVGAVSMWASVFVSLRDINGSVTSIVRTIGTGTPPIHFW